MKSDRLIVIVAIFSSLFFRVCNGMGSPTIVQTLSSNRLLYVVLSHNDFDISHILLKAMVDKGMIVEDPQMINKILDSQDDPLINTSYLSQRNANVIEKFLKSKKNIKDVQDQKGRTLLHILLKHLVKQPDSQILKAATSLLRAGINTTLRDNRGRLAWFYEKELAARESPGKKLVESEHRDFVSLGPPKEREYLRDAIGPRSVDSFSANEMVRSGEVAYSDTIEALKIIEFLKGLVFSKRVPPLVLLGAQEPLVWTRLTEELATKSGTLFIQLSEAIGTPRALARFIQRIVTEIEQEQMIHVVFLGEISTFKSAVLEEIMNLLTGGKAYPIPEGVAMVVAVSDIPKLVEAHPTKEGQLSNLKKKMADGSVHVLDLAAPFASTIEHVLLKDLFFNEKVIVQICEEIDKINDSSVNGGWFEPLLICGAAKSGKRQLARALATASSALFCSLTRVASPNGVIPSTDVLNNFIEYACKQRDSEKKMIIAFLGRLESLNDNIKEVLKKHLEQHYPGLYFVGTFLDAHDGNSDASDKKIYDQTPLLVMDMFALNIINVALPASNERTRLLRLFLDTYSWVNSDIDDYFCQGFAQATDDFSLPELEHLINNLLKRIIDSEIERNKYRKAARIRVIAPENIELNRAHIYNAFESLFTSRHYTDSEKRLKVLKDAFNLARLEELWGMERIINNLKNNILPFVKTGQPPAALPKVIRHLLFYGPPGTGKTSIAQGIARNLGWDFRKIRCSELKSNEYGGSGRRVLELFRKIRDEPRCVIFIDEVHALGRFSDNTHSADKELLTTLWTEMDSIKQEDLPYMILAAGNEIKDLEPAFKDRFETPILVPNPGEAGRKQILQDLCKGRSCAPDVNSEFLEKISKDQYTKNISGRGLFKLLDQAALIAMTEARTTAKSKNQSPEEINRVAKEASIDSKHIESALKEHGNELRRLVVEWWEKHPEAAKEISSGT